MKRPRYQSGTLYTESRKSGPNVWVYRWRETNQQGARQLRKQILGTERELPTQADAQSAAETFRLSANRHAVAHSGPPPTIRGLVEHYRLKETPMDNHEGKRRSTKLGYISNLENHIVPRWGDYSPGRVSAVEVEEWLKSLKLAPGSRAQVRNVLSMIFRHDRSAHWRGARPEVGGHRLRHSLGRGVSLLLGRRDRSV